MNLYKPEERPNYEIPVLTIHEAVPGHHLQIALAQELGELPIFRRDFELTAFVEGWALYSESLGDEMGLYEDPYDKFGQLTYEMWRAVRLVVDTGHASQALDAAAGDRLLQGQRRQDRARHRQRDRPLHRLAGPGARLQDRRAQDQGAARSGRRRQLGDRFDLRAFHDVVLGSGAVPLDVLERNVRRAGSKRKPRARRPSRRPSTVSAPASAAACPSGSAASPSAAVHPIVVQSMTNTDTADVEATALQVRALAQRGLGARARHGQHRRGGRGRAARSSSGSRSSACTVPIVGDFHFNGHKLLREHPGCAEALAKYRINPGNVGRGSKRDPQFAEMIETACRYGRSRCASASTGAASTRTC